MNFVRGVCGAHGGHETAEVRDVRRTGGGHGLRGGAGERVVGVSPGRPRRAFAINANQWTTAAQDEGEWRKTAEQEVESFMAKLIAAQKYRAGLRHAGVCPNVTGRTKEGIAQNKACSCWFARHSCLATSGAKLHPPGVFADSISPFLALFCLVLSFCFD